MTLSADDLIPALASALDAVATLRAAVVVLARERSPVDAEREALRAAVLSAPPRLTGARRIALALLDGLPPNLSLATRLGACTAAAWETWVDTGDVLAAGVYAELEALASRVPGCEPDLWLD